MVRRSVADLKGRMSTRRHHGWSGRLSIPSTREGGPLAFARPRVHRGGIMTGKARLAIAGAFIVAAWAIPGVSTPVAGAEPASCSAEGDFVADPGLSTSPSSGTV